MKNKEDFFMRIAQQNLGMASIIQPLMAPRFAPGPVMLDDLSREIMTEFYPAAFPAAKTHEASLTPPGQENQSHGQEEDSLPTSPPTSSSGPAAETQFPSQLLVENDKQVEPGTPPGKADPPRSIMTSRPVQETKKPGKRHKHEPQTQTPPLNTNTTNTIKNETGAEPKTPSETVLSGQEEMAVPVGEPGEVPEKLATAIASKGHEKAPLPVDKQEKVSKADSGISSQTSQTAQAEVIQAEPNKWQKGDRLENKLPVENEMPVKPGTPPGKTELPQSFTSSHPVQETKEPGERHIHEPQIQIPPLNTNTIKNETGTEPKTPSETVHPRQEEIAIPLGEPGEVPEKLATAVNKWGQASEPGEPDESSKTVHPGQEEIGVPVGEPGGDDLQQLMKKTREAPGKHPTAATAKENGDRLENNTPGKAEPLQPIMTSQPVQETKEPGKRHKHEPQTQTPPLNTNTNTIKNEIGVEPKTPSNTVLSGQEKIAAPLDEPGEVPEKLETAVTSQEHEKASLPVDKQEKISKADAGISSQTAQTEVIQAKPDKWQKGDRLENRLENKLPVENEMQVEPGTPYKWGQTSEPGEPGESSETVLSRQEEMAVPHGEPGEDDLQQPIKENTEVPEKIATAATSIEHEKAPLLLNKQEKVSKADSSISSQTAQIKVIQAKPDKWQNGDRLENRLENNPNTIKNEKVVEPAYKDLAENPAVHDLSVNTANLSQDHANLPLDQGNIPADQGTIPQHHGAFPGDNGTLPQHQENFPQDVSTSPPEAAAFPVVGAVGSILKQSTPVDSNNAEDAIPSNTQHRENTKQATPADVETRTHMPESQKQDIDVIKAEKNIGAMVQRVDKKEVLPEIEAAQAPISKTAQAEPAIMSRESTTDTPEKPQKIQGIKGASLLENLEKRSLAARLKKENRDSSSPPIIRVNIGRIKIDTEKPPPPPRKFKRPSPSFSLQDYHEKNHHIRR